MFGFAVVGKESSLSSDYSSFLDSPAFSPIPDEAGAGN